MSGGIGHVLLMIQSVKNNRNLIKKRKSFKDRKNFDNKPFSKDPDDAQLTYAINVHKLNIKFYERYSSIMGYILLVFVLVLISLYIFGI